MNTHADVGDEGERVGCSKPTSGCRCCPKLAYSQLSGWVEHQEIFCHCLEKGDTEGAVTLSWNIPKSVEVEMFPGSISEAKTRPGACVEAGRSLK